MPRLARAPFTQKLMHRWDVQKLADSCAVPTDCVICGGLGYFPVGGATCQLDWNISLIQCAPTYFDLNGLPCVGLACNECHNLGPNGGSEFFTVGCAGGSGSRNTGSVPWTYDACANVGPPCTRRRTFLVATGVNWSVEFTEYRGSVWCNVIVVAQAAVHSTGCWTSICGAMCADWFTWNPTLQSRGITIGGSDGWFGVGLPNPVCMVPTWSGSCDATTTTTNECGDIATVAGSIHVQLIA